MHSSSSVKAPVPHEGSENTEEVGEIREVKDPSVSHSAARTGGSQLVYMAVEGSNELKLMNLCVSLSLDCFLFG